MQLGRALSIDNVTGIDVRNLQDERLGAVNDLILNPNTGAVSHVIIVAASWGSDAITPRCLGSTSAQLRP
jgi:sporulation protein YlmC with PRC-barrel domain